MNARGFFTLGHPSRSLFARLSRPIQSGMCGGCLLLVFLIIFLPVFFQFYRPYRHHYCISNEKQICLGLLQYAQDFDEQLPVGTRSNRLGLSIRQDTPRQAKFHVGQGWAGANNPYTKNPKILQCPYDETVARDGLYSVSYAYNRNVALNPKLAKLTRPEATILLVETEGNSANVMSQDEHNDVNVYSAAGNGLNILAATDGTTEPEVAAGARYATGTLGRYDTTPGCALWPLAAAHVTQGRHHDGAVYALADGHVQFCKPEQVSPGDNAVNSRDAQNCVYGHAAGTARLELFSVTFSTK